CSTTRVHTCALPTCRTKRPSPRRPAAAPRRDGARRRAEPPRLLAVCDEPLHVLDQTVDVRVDEAAHAVLDGRRHFGRREPDDGHTAHHGFDDGEPQARVANRIEEEAVARYELR